MGSIKKMYQWMISPSHDKTKYAKDRITGEIWSLYDHIEYLQNQIYDVEEKYQHALEDIKRLEEENVETTNVLYEILNRLDSMDQSEYTLKNFELGDH